MPRADLSIVVARAEGRMAEASATMSVICLVQQCKDQTCRVVGRSYRSNRRYRAHSVQAMRLLWFCKASFVAYILTVMSGQSLTRSKSRRRRFARKCDMLIMPWLFWLSAGGHFAESVDILRFDATSTETGRDISSHGSECHMSRNRAMILDV